MSHRYYTVFQEPWWLEATAPGEWDEVSVESGGRVIARLPFVVKDQGRLRYLTQPPLTQTLGPWVEDTKSAYTKALSRTNHLYAELIRQLPRHDSFYQNFAPQVSNWLPFYWEGFTESTRYTYQLDLRISEEQLLAEMDKKNRSQLRKAANHLIATTEDDLGTFLDLNRSSFKRQGLDVPYSDNLVYRIDEAAKQHASRSIVICRDQVTGTPHAGIYMVHYSGVTHSLMSGVNEDLRDQNGMIVARWKAIQTAKSLSDTLDFQGSMMRSIERRNRNYGAHQIPIMTISRKSPQALRTERNTAIRKSAYRNLMNLKRSITRTEGTSSR